MENDISPLLQQIAPVSAPQAVSQAAASPQNAPQSVPQDGSLFGPAVVLEISQEGRAAYEASIANDGKDNTTSGIAEVEGPKECQTCKNRRYVDESDDPSVSFQTPTKVSPEAAMSAVAAHEGEHVRNEQMKAESEGRKVVSQSVSINTDICPECGRVYVSGGETRTVTAPDDKQNQQNQLDQLDQGQVDRKQAGRIDLFA